MRRQILTGEVSKRQACKRYKLYWDTLMKILRHEEPPPAIGRGEAGIGAVRGVDPRDARGRPGGAEEATAHGQADSGATSQEGVTRRPDGRAGEGPPPAVGRGLHAVDADNGLAASFVATVRRDFAGPTGHLTTRHGPFLRRITKKRASEPSLRR